MFLKPEQAERTAVKHVAQQHKPNTTVTLQHRTCIKEPSFHHQVGRRPAVTRRFKTDQHGTLLLVLCIVNFYTSSFACNCDLFIWRCLELRHFMALFYCFSSFSNDVHINTRLEAENVTGGTVDPDVWNPSSSPDQLVRSSWKVDPAVGGPSHLWCHFWVFQMRGNG